MNKNFFFFFTNPKASKDLNKKACASPPEIEFQSMNSIK